MREETFEKEVDKLKTDIWNLVMDFRKENNWVWLTIDGGSYDMNPDGDTIHGFDVKVNLSM